MAGVIVSVLTVASGVWKVSKAVQAQFESKLVDTVLVSHDPDEAHARARYMVSLLGSTIPEGLAQRLAQVQPADYSKDADTEPKLELVRLLADHPKERGAVLADWEALFGGKAVELLRNPKFKAQAKGLPQNNIYYLAVYD